MDKKVAKKNSVRIQNKEITTPFVVNAIKKHSKEQECNHQQSFLFFTKKGIAWWLENNQK